MDQDLGSGHAVWHVIGFGVVEGCGAGLTLVLWKSWRTTAEGFAV